MRYIDADELDKALAKECNECMHDEHDCEVCNFAIARLYVKAAPTIEAEPVDDWISVKDRLPELYKNVLTIGSDGKIFINWLEDIIEMKGYFAYGGGTVTHWQHLPKPPKGE